MPRNAAGTYTLPAGNPVVTLTTITSAWANTTMPDLGNEITNSLDRQGRGSMLDQLKLFDGTQALPGMTFSAEPSSGFFRSGAGNIGLSILNTLVMTATATGLSWALAAGAVGTPSLFFSGDTNTGIYSPGAGIVAMATDGVEQLRARSGGVSIKSDQTGAALVVDRLGTSLALPAATAGTTAIFTGASSAGSPSYLSVIAGNASSSGLNFGDTDGDSRGYVRYSHGLDAMFFGTNGLDRLYIDSSGNVLQNQGTNTYTASGMSSNRFQQASTGGDGGMAFSNWSGAAGTGSDLIFLKSRGATIGAHAVVANGDNLMQIVGAGDDGTDFIQSARIMFQVDGTPGANDMPGRIVFSVTRDGASAVTEAMRISSNGQVGIAAPASGNSALVVDQVAGNAAILSANSLAGTPSFWLLQNTSTAASSSALIQITTAGATAGDPYTRYDISGAQSWTTGIDNSDNDAYKISSGTTPGAGESLTVFVDGRVAGTALHNNAGSVTGTANQYIASGTYTPTITAVTNITTAGSAAASWCRVGNVVTVGFECTIDPTTAAGTASEVGISLPIASNFISADCNGAASSTGGTATQCGVITTDTVNDRARLLFACQDAASRSWNGVFQYRVL